MATKLLDQVCEAIRIRHLSPKTEEAYTHWNNRNILNYKKRHPTEDGASVPQYSSFMPEKASENGGVTSNGNRLSRKNRLSGVIVVARV
ncbi:MAG: hypothetical protein HUU02_14670 [Bacteroidetes bacterium]|nr:hypothetical protein [Bacteroidota bacterium]